MQKRRGKKKERESYQWVPLHRIEDKNIFAFPTQLNSGGVHCRHNLSSKVSVYEVWEERERAAKKDNTINNLASMWEREREVLVGINKEATFALLYIISEAKVSRKETWQREEGIVNSMRQADPSMFSVSSSYHTLR